MTTPTPVIDNFALTLPAGLWDAVKASVLDKGIPRQGCAALRSIAVLAMEKKDLSPSALIEYAKAVADWVETQEPAQLLADEFVEALALREDSIKDGVVPSWFAEPWHQVLRLPWSEDLLDAVLEAGAVIANE